MGVMEWRRCAPVAFTLGMLAVALHMESKAMASERILAELASGLVPGPVEYAALAPEGWREMEELPLILNLHGGGGSRQQLLNQQRLWDRLWASGSIPPLLVVMPSVTERGFYMNFKDGTERWEDFIVGPLLEHLRASYPVTSDPARTFLMGASMGGMGSLRIAFRYPQRFGAVAALEPGIEPILAWDEMRPKHRFWRSDALLERAYGKPVDPEFWAANNPASMAVAGADAIRRSGLQIYFEAGDEDQFWLYEGAEFLHQTLWQLKIRHEYHLVRGADHIGPSLGERSEEAIRFLIRSYQPWGKPPLVLRAVMQAIELQKLGVDERDHYNQPD